MSARIKELFISQVDKYIEAEARDERAEVLLKDIAFDGLLYQCNFNLKAYKLVLKNIVPLFIENIHPRNAHNFGIRIKPEAFTENTFKVFEELNKPTIQSFIKGMRYLGEPQCEFDFPAEESSEEKMLAAYYDFTALLCDKGKIIIRF